MGSSGEGSSSSPGDFVHPDVVAAVEAARSSRTLTDELLAGQRELGAAARRLAELTDNINGRLTSDKIKGVTSTVSANPGIEDALGTSLDLVGQLPANLVKPPEYVDPEG